MSHTRHLQPPRTFIPWHDRAVCGCAWIGVCVRARVYVSVWVCAQCDSWVCAQCDSHRDCVCMSASVSHTAANQVGHHTDATVAAQRTMLHRCSIRAATCFSILQRNPERCKRGAPRCNTAHHCSLHSNEPRCSLPMLQHHKALVRSVAARPEFSASRATVTNCTRIAQASEAARGYSIHLQAGGSGGWGCGV